MPADLVLLAMGFMSPVGGILEKFGVERDGRGNALAGTEDETWLRHQRAGRVRGGRHAPGPVAGGLGHPRGPSGGARGRPLPDGEFAAAELSGTKKTPARCQAYAELGQASKQSVVDRRGVLGGRGVRAFGYKGGPDKGCHTEAVKESAMGPSWRQLRGAFALGLVLLGAGLPPLGQAAAVPAAPAAQVADSDADGYPDAAELSGQDRARFADWFAAVAQSQYYGMNQDWAAQDRDCGGLLRYAFINALMAHDAAWFAKFRYLPRPQQTDVQALTYPLPVISRSVFRVAGGAYQPGDIEAGKLVGRSGVQYLATYSMVKRLARHQSGAPGRRADLHSPESALVPQHGLPGRRLVVYHTGASPERGRRGAAAERAEPAALRRAGLSSGPQQSQFPGRLPLEDSGLTRAAARTAPR